MTSMEVLKGCYYVDPKSKTITQINEIEYGVLNNCRCLIISDGILWIDESIQSEKWTFYEIEYCKYQLRYVKRNPIDICHPCYVTGKITEGVETEWILFGYQEDIESCVEFTY